VDPVLSENYLNDSEEHSSSVKNLLKLSGQELFASYN